MPSALQIRRSVNSCGEVYHAVMHGNLVYTILPQGEVGRGSAWAVVDDHNRVVNTTPTLSAAKRYIRACFT